MKRRVVKAIAQPTAQRAPENFRVRLETTKGDAYINVTRAWSPLGADRFYQLVKSGYYQDVAFFRVINGFMAQTGIHGKPEISAKWASASIKDDPVRKSNLRGMVTFATAGKNTRDTQFFVNFRNNSRLDRMGFSPFGYVDAAGMKVIDALYAGYGEGAPRGRGPNQVMMRRRGNAYLKQSFPRLDYIKRASIVSAPARAKVLPPTKAAQTPTKPAAGPPAAIGGPAKATLTAPAQFKVKLITTKGEFIIRANRSWAPIGADRFYNLVKLGFYNNTAFFRVIPGFMAQVGMSGLPAVTKAWSRSDIKDDPVKQTNSRGMVTFAKTGRPNSRTTQFFINFKNNGRLDGMGFAPFGQIDAAGMKIVNALYSGYGEGRPRGRGPAQGLIKSQGNTYLKKGFPRLDYILRAVVVP